MIFSILTKTEAKFPVRVSGDSLTESSELRDSGVDVDPPWLDAPAAEIVADGAGVGDGDPASREAPAAGLGVGVGETPEILLSSSSSKRFSSA